MTSLPKQKNHDLLIDLSLSLKQIKMDMEQVKKDISHIKNDIRIRKIKDMKKELPKEEEPVETGWFWRS